jgi:hypothetical protein
MNLLTAHKILIGSAIAFFLFFGANRLLTFQSSGDPVVLTTAIGGLVVSVALAFYYRTIRARH